MTLVCTIVKNKIMTTKSNTLMAFTTVEDLTGSMELLVFPRILAECARPCRKNAVVVANGRVSVKEDERPPDRRGRAAHRDLRPR